MNPDIPGEQEWVKKSQRRVAYIQGMYDESQMFRIEQAASEDIFWEALGRTIRAETFNGARIFTVKVLVPDGNEQRTS